MLTVSLPSRPRVIRVAPPVKRLVERLEDRLEHLALAAREVVVERAARHPRAIEDRRHGGGLVALLLEALPSGRQQPSARRFGLLSPSHLSSLAILLVDRQSVN